MTSMGFNLCPRSTHEWISPHFHKITVYSTGPLIATIKANGTMYGLAEYQQPRAAWHLGVQQGAACKHLHPEDGHCFDYCSALPLPSLRVVSLKDTIHRHQLPSCFNQQLLPALCYSFGQALTPEQVAMAYGNFPVLEGPGMKVLSCGFGPYHLCVTWNIQLSETTLPVRC